MSTISSTFPPAPTVNAPAAASPDKKAGAVTLAEFAQQLAVTQGLQERTGQSVKAVLEGATGANMLDLQFNMTALGLETETLAKMIAAQKETLEKVLGKIG